MTQEQMAEKVGIKRSLLGAYEEGRADPRISNLMKFAEIYHVSVDDLIGIDMEATHGTGITAPKYVGQNGHSMKVLSITVDSEENENIELVPQKASAGYLNGYADPEFIGDLPKFQLPMLPKNATYRAFEINGDSMLPLQSGTTVIGKYIDNVSYINDGKTYILVTQREGVVYKRVYDKIKEKGVLVFVSDNKLYAPYEVNPEDVIEIWEAKAFISLAFPDVNTNEDELSLKKIASIVMDLQQEVIKLKEK